MTEANCPVCNKKCCIGGGDKEGTYYYIPIDESVDLKREVVELKGKIASLIKSYDTHLKLVVEELGELAAVARIHGWKSTRYEQGAKNRQAIIEAKARLFGLTNTEGVIYVSADQQFV